MTISSATASRRYLEKSSLIFATGTAFVGFLDWRAPLFEPFLRFGFRDDRKDLDLCFCNVIKHPDVAHAQAILRLAQPTKSLDSTLADLPGLMRQMLFERLGDARANGNRKFLEREDGLWTQHDLEGHSGQIIARFLKGCRYVGLQDAS